MSPANPRPWYQAVVLLCLLAATELSAEVGWRHVGDLNGDGVSDRVESGPQEYFGNGGGIYLLTLSSGDGPQRFLITAGWQFAPETLHNGDSKIFRLWTFMRSGPNGGSLISHTVARGKLDTVMIPVLYPPEGQSGESISHLLWGAFLNSKSYCVLSDIENYTPPDISGFGLDWDKSP